MTLKIISFIFQSTLSVRRATLGDPRIVRTQSISIHALREESDCNTHAARHGPTVFQSTLSVRRATIFITVVITVWIFQSTLSVRRATFADGLDRVSEVISIHALREASDRFFPFRVGVVSISIHALREESDCTDGQHVSHCGTSILRTSSRVAGFEVKTRYSNHSTKK